MSKKAGKSAPNKGAEKSDKRATPTNEVIPGIPDVEWNYYLDVEERDSFISSVLNDLILKSQNIISSKYVDSIAVASAVDDLCHVLEESVELHFMSRDPGDVGAGFDIDWAEDLPPAPSLIDNWAQGKVPVISQMQRPSSRTSLSESIHSSQSTISSFRQLETLKNAELESGENGAEKNAEKSAENIKIGENCGTGEFDEVVGATNLSETHLIDAIPFPSSAPSNAKPIIKDKKPKFKRYTGRLKSPNVKNLTTSITETEEKLIRSQLFQNSSSEMEKSSGLGGGPPPQFLNALKILETRPGPHDIEYDGDGNITSVRKIPPNELPRLRRVKTSYTIEEIENKNGNYEKSKAGKEFRNKNATRGNLGKINQKLKPQFQGGSQFNQIQYNRLIDTIDLRAGVTVREGDIIREGPSPSLGRNLSTRSAHVLNLAPIRICQASPLSATDIANNPSEMPPQHVSN